MLNSFRVFVHAHCCVIYSLNIYHCTAGLKKGFQGLDLWLIHLMHINCFMLVDLKWSNFNFSYSGKMELPIWHRQFCSVGSPYIAEVIHWSHPSHRVEKWLSLKFGVDAFFMCRVILKISQLLSCCSASAANWQNVTCLSRYHQDITSGCSDS